MKQKLKRFFLNAGYRFLELGAKLSDPKPEQSDDTFIWSLDLTFEATKAEMGEMSDRLIETMCNGTNNHGHHICKNPAMIGMSAIRKVENVD